MSGRRRVLSDAEKHAEIERIERETEESLRAAEELAWRTTGQPLPPGVRRAEEAIAGVCARSGMTAIDERTPFVSLAEEEERELYDEELRELLRGRRLTDVQAALAAMRRLARHEGENDLLGDLFADGFHPERVMRRVYAYAMTRNPELVAGMGKSEFASMVGETRAATGERMKLLFESRGERQRNGKGEQAKRKMAAAQRGNGNRRNGGKKKLKGEK